MDNKNKILKISDGVADERTIFRNKAKLPTDAKFVEIDGANHAQFGYYGFFN